MQLDEADGGTYGVNRFDCGVEQPGSSSGS